MRDRNRKNTAYTAILCDMASNNQLIAGFFENFPNYPKVLVHNGLVLGDRSKACKYMRLIKSLDNNRVFLGDMTNKPEFALRKSPN